MTLITERYNPIPMAVNATYTSNGGSRQAVGFFCAVTSGSISLINDKGVTVLNSFPVSAGNCYRLPFFMGNGAKWQAVLAGGASGTLGV